MSAPTQRRRVGGDVYLTPLPSATGADWRVDVGFAVPDWKAAAAATQVQAAFPGTAVLVDDRWYEICRLGPLRNAPHRTAYDLRPWNDAEVIRTAFELTPSACDELTRRYRELERRRHGGSALRYLPFLTGLLPAADQKRLETELGVPATRATFISAALLLGSSMTVIMVTFALSQGMHFGDSQELVRTLAKLAPLATYFFAESLVRMASANGKEPMGSKPVCLPIYVIRSLSGMHVTREELDERLARRPPADGLLAARDRVRPLSHPEYDLEVVSRLPKDHWTAGVTGIEYQDEAYMLLDREQLETPDGPRHRFLLQKAHDAVLFKSYLRYRPEEVRDIYRAQQRAKTATWVETFAFLWGFTAGPIQRRLAKQFNYDPDRWTRGSIVTSLVAGALLVVRGVGAMAGGFASAGTTAAFFAGIFLLWEGVIRRSKHRAGGLPGSLVGLVFEPLARRCLRWE